MRLTLAIGLICLLLEPLVSVVAAQDAGVSAESAGASVQDAGAASGDDTSAPDAGAEGEENPAGGSGAPPGDPNQDLMRRIMGQGPQIATAEPSTDVPQGAIHVLIVTHAGSAVADAEVKVGVMAPGGVRDELEARTNEQGVATFTELATGTARSYRVRHEFEGATYASSPFRLPTDRGYQVVLRQWPTTQDDRNILQFYGETQLQFVQDRLRVVHHAQLMNPFDRTYVFPEGGLQIALPDGFTGFQSPSVMTDQRLLSNDEGFQIEGSVPPGRVRLTWAFDLPIDSERIDIELPVVWRTMRYGIIAEAREEMTLNVPGFPAAEAAQRGAVRVLTTQLQRRPGDEPFERVELRLGGIPQPGPMRWIALGLTIAFLLPAAWRRRRREGKEGTATPLDVQRSQILESLAVLEREHAEGEVGPQYYAKQKRALMVDLAWILREMKESDAK